MVKSINLLLNVYECIVILLSVPFQSLRNKEGSGAQPQSVPPPSVPSAEQRPQSSSPGGKPPDPSPPRRSLLPPSSHTESEAESLLEELQKGREQMGLAGGSQNTSSYSFSYKMLHCQSGFR